RAGMAGEHAKVRYDERNQEVEEDLDCSRRRCLSVNQNVTFVDRRQDSSDDEGDPDRTAKVVAPATDPDRVRDRSPSPVALDPRQAHERFISMGAVRCKWRAGRSSPSPTYVDRFAARGCWTDFAAPATPRAEPTARLRRYPCIVCIRTGERACTST